MASITATDFRKHQKPHHTDRNRKCPIPAPDRTQLRGGSPRRRQAGTKNSAGTRKPVLFAAQESPDDLSDSGGGTRKRQDCGVTRSKDPGLERLPDLAGQVFSIPIHYLQSVDRTDSEKLLRGSIGNVSSSGMRPYR